MRQQIGMTFLELILVMAILGILASIAVPNFSGAFDAVDEKEVADKLMADLRQARSMAQACAGGGVTVNFASNDHLWTVEPSDCGSDINGPKENVDIGMSGVDKFDFRYPLGDTNSDSDLTIDIGDSTKITVRSSGQIERSYNESE